MSEIRQIERLLKAHLPPGSVIVDQKVSNLTSPGDNYGSLMLKIEVKIKTGGKDELINLVGKKIPENEWLQEMFQIQHTFEKEIEFYNTILPTLQNFQVEQGMEKILDFFPKYFGGRKNLNPGSKLVDEDGVLLLENLKIQGYMTMDRIKGFDLDVAKFILCDLARFHASGIALRLKKPEIFETRLLPYLQHIELFTDDVKECTDTMLNKYEVITGDNEECARLYPKVKNAVMKALNQSQKEESHFSTIIHNDYWINNTMVKFGNGKPISSKMIDFQIIEYDSLAKDVIFFLYSSVQTSVLEQHFDDLIEVYFDTLITNLRELRCDTSPFTMESFENELTKHSSVEFFHLMFMLKPICVSPHQIKDIKDMSVEDLHVDDIPQRLIEKCCFIIKDFAKKEWI